MLSLDCVPGNWGLQDWKWAPEEGMKQVFNRGVLQGTVGQRPALSEFLVMVMLEMLVVVTVLAVSVMVVMGQ